MQTDLDEMKNQKEAESAGNPQPLIRCSHVTVEYRIRQRYTHTLKDWFVHCRNRLGPWFKPDGFKKQETNKTKVFYALKDLSFEVYPGDTVGVIGSNGAGKSTLLRHLAGTEFLDQGEIMVRGKVGPLLNLTAGFRPHLSGMENIYLRGSLLGYRQAQIKEMIPQIEAFCEVGEFIYAPYKVYSSGMKARLGFAISLFVKPDILLLDEVIGAGDEKFRKSVGSIFDNFQKKTQGAIVVSTHNLSLLRSNCNKVLWLEKGEKKAFGKADDIIDAYQQQDLPAK